MAYKTIPCPPPPCASTAAVPKNQAKQRFNAHPMLVCGGHDGQMPMTAHIQESPQMQMVIGCGRGTAGMAKNHIKTNIIELQCGDRMFYTPSYTWEYKNTGPKSP